MMTKMGSFLKLETTSYPGTCNPKSKNLIQFLIVLFFFCGKSSACCTTSFRERGP